MTLIGSMNGTMVRRMTLALALLGAPLSAAAAQGGAPAPERAQLEQRLRERLARVVQQRLALDQAQMRRLQATSQRFEKQRLDLVRQERDARMQLREELVDSSSADQAKVSGLIDRLLGLQRQRLDVLAAEQKELATFLTPIQRAKYLALQDQLRRRVEQMRQRQAGRRGQAGRAGGAEGGGPPF